jgi:hypothetical protein
MSPHVTLSSLLQQKLRALSLLLGFFIFLSITWITSATIQSAQDNDHERKFENGIPPNMPIKVKIRNEQSFKDLNNEHWMHDLEIEVENRSDKPIYHLLLSLTLPDILTENNRSLTFPLRYGRPELVDFSAPLQPDDVPIRPGESYVFKIPEQLQQGWARFITRRNLPKDEPKKAQLEFLNLNFGDGTGFGTSDGAPIDIHRKQASSCGGDKSGRTATMLSSKPPNDFFASPLKVTTFYLPADFLPVKFSPVNKRLLAS